ncbi:hypothetical protein CAL7716_079510 [Calothrix sp. PCC 7716]|nr:hypothetical protein CAL7716_079510 [Calothrix sp. PCC 7716]
MYPILFVSAWFATDITDVTDVTDDLFVTNKIFKLSASPLNESTISSGSPLWRRELACGVPPALANFRAKHVVGDTTKSEFNYNDAPQTIKTTMILMAPLLDEA